MAQFSPQMEPMPALKLGAVAYEPRVVTIWDGLTRWFLGQGLPVQFVLYASYEQQVAAHLAGHIDVAWNSPLAYLQTVAGTHRRPRALAMRDSDRDMRSVIVANADSPVRTLADLNGKRVAVGAADSPQATILPLYLLHQAGVRVEAVCFDPQRGKHGELLDGERAAAQALTDFEVDAACMLDSNLLLFALEGVLPSGLPRVIAQTEPYDNRCLTVFEDAQNAQTQHFHDLLMEMDYNDPALRSLFDLEGLRGWKPGRTLGYEQIAAAAATVRAQYALA